MNRATHRNVERIRSQFVKLQTSAERAESRVERVSGWSIGQHIDHLMKADRSILRRFDEPQEGPLPPMSTAGRLVLWTGWIPRGKGVAPKAALPEAPSAEELSTEIDGVRVLFEQALEPRERFGDRRPIARHHVFGGLSIGQWLRFIAVHHHHHVKIIGDILRDDSA